MRSSATQGHVGVTHGADRRRLRITLVACGATKRTQPSAAKDLYVGDLFTKSRVWAEQNSDRWYVLSAKHGLLYPDRVIEPYDRRMPSRRDDVVHWARRVSDDLRLHDATLTTYSTHGSAGSLDLIGPGALLMGGGIVDITLLAGRAYSTALVPLLETWATRVVRPLAGLGIGQQKALLRASAADLQRAMLD